MDSDPFSFALLHVPTTVLTQLIQLEFIFLFLAFILLIFLAVINGARISIFGMSARDINTLKKRGKRSFRAVLRLLENPKQVLASILVLDNLLSIAFILASYYGLRNILTVGSLGSLSSEVVSMLLQALVIVFFLVFFGKILPRTYAIREKLRFSVLASPVIGLMAKVVRPISALLADSQFMEGKFLVSSSESISKEDIEDVYEAAAGAPASKEERMMFEGIIRFPEIQVKQIMIPRLDMIGLNQSATFKEVKQKVKEHGLSRFPVYENTMDSLIGIMHTKDLLPYVHEEQHEWKALMRDIQFVPETKYASDLLREFKQNKVHMAIVVDEFGGTAGLVTLEDVLEEIVGELNDEFDEQATGMRKVDDSQYIFDGRTLINDACRFMNISVSTFKEIRGENDSVAGLVLELAGNFPRINERIIHGKYQFTVLELEKNRINKLKVLLLD